MNEPVYVRAGSCFDLSHTSRWVSGQYQSNICMIKAKMRPEIWNIFTALYFTPKNAPNIKKTIQRKCIMTTISARIL